MEITNREWQVLQLISEEYTSKEIAQKLFLSTETINSHRKNMMNKLKARNTAGLVAKAYRQGLMAVSTCILILFSQVLSLNGQVRNLHIEGSEDQYGVIQTTSTINSKSGIELLRGNQFGGTDWRIQNDDGKLLFEDGIDNFMTAGDINMSIGFQGIVNMFNGTDAEATNNTSGTLILGDPSSFHISLDNNSIIARNNNIGSRLLIQTGLDKGDTYLNNISGNVGIGTIAPETKLGIEDNGFQMRLGNTEQFDNDWYIGASHEGWTVGGGKLVISPSTSSGNAMLVLDNDNSTISARSNRVIGVEDPINDRDVVNLRTLNTAVANFNTALADMSFLSPKDLSLATTIDLTFAQCALHCRNLTQNGYSDWTIPSLEQASHFVGWTVSSQVIWTSDYELHSLAWYEPLIDAPVERRFSDRLLLDIQNGDVSRSSEQPRSGPCRCIR